MAVPTTGQGSSNQEHDDTCTTFVVNLPGSEARFLVTKRPYINRCLEHLSAYYEMAIFTAAE